MPNEHDGEGEPPKAPPSAGDTARPAPVGGIEQRIVGLANDWLKTRLGLEERPDGTLELPQRGAFENLGEKADQFMRGFFRGFVEKTPEEREAQTGLREPTNVPSATEVAGRLLSRASAAVTGAFHEYLKDEVAPPAGTTPPAAPAPSLPPVPIDGRFLLRHGAPLIGRIVQALGTAFSNPSEANAAPATAAQAPHSDPNRRVDYQVDLPSLMKSLLTGRAPLGPTPAPTAAPAAPAAPATPTATAAPAAAPASEPTPAPTPASPTGGETP